MVREGKVCVDGEECNKCHLPGGVMLPLSSLDCGKRQMIQTTFLCLPHISKGHIGCSYHLYKSLLQRPITWMIAHAYIVLTMCQVLFKTL